MRKSNKKSSLAKWQKFGWASLLVLVVAYHFGRPTLEKVTGLSLPALDGSQQQVELGDDNPAENSTSKSSQAQAGPRNREVKSAKPRNTELRNDSQRNDSRTASNPETREAKPDSRNKGTQPNDDEFPLEKVGRNKFQTPAGLVYGMGARGEHRIEHVMLHAEDEPGKPVHGVFLSRDKSEVLQMIDDAYERIKNKARGVKTSNSGTRGDRVEYTVDMNRKIGFEGGQSGARKKHPALYKIKLVLQSGNEVITAFPYR